MLPILLDDKDAVDNWNKDISDAVRSYIVSYLTIDEGMSNEKIRKLLGIKAVYEVTHLRRAGRLSDEELLLWDKNKIRITLSHIRAIALLPKVTRIDLMRKLLVKKIPSRIFEELAKQINENKQKETNPTHLLESLESSGLDTSKYAELMSEHTGRPTKMKFNPKKKSGTITLQFFGLEDLSNLALQLGFDESEVF